MAWYQCSCGFLKEMAPRLGEAITSVCHLHRAARLDGTSMIVRMEEIPNAQPNRAEMRAEDAIRA